MNNITTGIKSKRIENAIKDTVGNEFERNAQFLLHLIFKNYRKTRLNKDGGIDGYIYTNAFILPGSNRPVEYFSIYGPEAKTPTKDRIKKLKQDFVAINSHAAEYGVRIKKWYIVINFDITTDIERQILNLCKEHKFKVEILYPMQVVKMINNNDKLFEALAFTDQVEPPNIKMTALHYHAFTKLSLQMIVDKATASTTEQLSLLRGLHQNILFFTPNDTKSPFSHNIDPTYIDYWLYKNTKLANKESIYVHEYDLTRNKLLTYEKEFLWEELMPTEHIIYKNTERNSIFIRVENLQFIYSFVLTLYHQIVSRGYSNYDIAHALDFHNFYNRSLKRFIKDIERDAKIRK